LLDKLERKFRNVKAPNMMIILVICYIAGFVVSKTVPEIMAYLYFEPYLIMRGQIWRLFTFVFVPSSSDYFLALITCFIYFSISKALEQVIGRFRVNFFLISGLVIEVLFGFLYFFMFRGSMNEGWLILLNPYYLYAMMFVLFAMMFPDARFLLMFIIPIRGKWMVLVTFAMYALDVFQAFRQVGSGYGWILVFMIVAAIVNLILYILLTGYRPGNSPSNVIRRNEFKRKAAGREKEIRAGKAARHKCAVCGRTELTNPELDFRYCSKCQGDYEYCSEHLYTHIHRGSDSSGENNV